MVIGSCPCPTPLLRRQRSTADMPMLGSITRHLHGRDNHQRMPPPRFHSVCSSPRQIRFHTYPLNDVAHDTVNHHRHFTVRRLAHTHTGELSQSFSSRCAVSLRPIQSSRFQPSSIPTVHRDNGVSIESLFPANRAGSKVPALSSSTGDRR